MNSSSFGPSSSSMNLIQAPKFVDENAPNTFEPQRVLKPKQETNPSVAPISFQSPPRRGALRDVSVTSSKKTPVRSSPLRQYDTRSSAKKARRVEDAEVEEEEENDIQLNDSVTVTNGTYVGRTGLVKGITDRTFKLSINGKLTGNIPKTSVVKGGGGGGGGVQVSWPGGGRVWAAVAIRINGNTTNNCKNPLEKDHGLPIFQARSSASHWSNPQEEEKKVHRRR
jgi:ribosomal protein L21E